MKESSARGVKNMTRLNFRKIAEHRRSYRATNITDVNPAYAGAVKAIEIFYMSANEVGASNWGWTMCRYDEHGNQVGDGEYCCYKAEAVERANWIAANTEVLDS